MLEMDLSHLCVNLCGRRMLFRGLYTALKCTILQKRLFNIIAGRPKAALLFWFFGGFRCGVPLFIVIFVIYLYKNRLK